MRFDVDAVRTRRLRAHPRGRRVDVCRTLRAGLRGGAIPLRWREPVRRPPPLVVLCDISTSMRPVAEFMLHLLYELQDQVAKTRSFAFIDHIEDPEKIWPVEEGEEEAAEAAQKIPERFS